jgi:hypothetical protein
MKYVDNIDKEIESVAGKMVKGKKSSRCHRVAEESIH